MRPYGDLGLVRIADAPVEFIQAAGELLAKTDNGAWLRQVDHFLADMSWDQTWSQMWNMVEQVMEAKRTNKGRAKMAIGLKGRRAQAATAS